jgi:hypothetical protein
MTTDTTEYRTIQGIKMQHQLHPGEVLIIATSTLGVYTGEFVATESTWEELQKFNASPKGGNYFTKKEDI